MFTQEAEACFLHQEARAPFLSPFSSFPSPSPFLSLLPSHILRAPKDYEANILDTGPCLGLAEGKIGFFPGRTEDTNKSPCHHTTVSHVQILEMVFSQPRGRRIFHPHQGQKALVENTEESISWLLNCKSLSHEDSKEKNGMKSVTKVLSHSLCPQMSHCPSLPPAKDLYWGGESGKKGERMGKEGMFPRLRGSSSEMEPLAAAGLPIPRISSQDKSEPHHHNPEFYQPSFPWSQ